METRVSRKKNREDRLPPFIPLFKETMRSAAWKQLSFGARILFIALRSKFCNNNGHVYISLRDAAVEIGHVNRSDLANWFRELEHYGFIVKTIAASLGLDGRGKAAHWRLTELPTRKDNNELAGATKDFLHWDGTVFEPHVAPSRRWNPTKKAALKKQNPGLHVGTTVDCTSVPVLGYTSVPPNEQSGTNVQSIQGARGGTNVQSITSIATSVPTNAAKSPWHTPVIRDLGPPTPSDMRDWLMLSSPPIQFQVSAASHMN
jgi:hypothetical protein